MKSNNLPELDIVKASNDFDFLKKIAVENNFQSCIVAPTEILAQQHFSSFINYLSDININVKILTGSTTKLQRNLILSDLIIGEIDVLIGTHALFEDDVRFKNLG